MSSRVINYKEIKEGKQYCKYCEKEATRNVWYIGLFLYIFSDVCEEHYIKEFIDKGRVR